MHRSYVLIKVMCLSKIFATAGVGVRRLMVDNCNESGGAHVLAHKSSVVARKSE